VPSRNWHGTIYVPLVNLTTDVLFRHHHHSLQYSSQTGAVSCRAASVLRLCCANHLCLFHVNYIKPVVTFGSPSENIGNLEKNRCYWLFKPFETLKICALLDNFCVNLGLGVRPRPPAPPSLARAVRGMRLINGLQTVSKIIHNFISP